jgi:hypothetical protein
MKLREFITLAAARRLCGRSRPRNTRRCRLVNFLLSAEGKMH